MTSFSFLPTDLGHEDDVEVGHPQSGALQTLLRYSDDAITQQQKQLTIQTSSCSMIHSLSLNEVELKNVDFLSTILQKDLEGIYPLWPGKALPQENSQEDSPHGWVHQQ
ncbi:hypothetical protein TNCV_4974661 [Trichonephila clavipes]|uniref:Uncharacterized protein n=1 Tax=Trichonephila clavipes TaxID=2585209 RepID=A0A8X6SEX1_TRICX|nr:hypothetical protein TNCV_4974661 [Trichonephila clavipes]